MAFRVDLSVQVEDALKELPAEGHRDVMEVIAAALARRGSWPVPGGWEVRCSRGGACGWRTRRTATTTRPLQQGRLPQGTHSSLKARHHEAVGFPHAVFGCARCVQAAV